MILGGASQHGRPPNVDILDRLIQSHIGFGNRCLEGVEIDDDQIDGLYLMLIDRGTMFGMLPQVKQTAMDFGMKRLDATIQHLRKTGVITQFDSLEAGFPDCSSSATGGNDFHTGFR